MTHEGICPGGIVNVTSPHRQQRRGVNMGKTSEQTITGRIVDVDDVRLHPSRH